MGFLFSYVFNSNKMSENTSLAVTVIILKALVVSA